MPLPSNPQDPNQISDAMFASPPQGSNAKAAAMYANDIPRDPQHQMAAELGDGKVAAAPAAPTLPPAAQAPMAPDSQNGQGDYMRWDEVVKTKGYLDLPLQAREKARQQYFKEVIAPNVNVDDLGQVRKQFDADTTGAAGFSLLPNDDDANIGNRATTSRHWQQLGVPQTIADKLAMLHDPPIDSRRKAIMDQGVEDSASYDSILGWIGGQAAGTGALRYLGSAIAKRKAAQEAAAVASREAEVTAESAYGTTNRFSGSRVDQLLASSAEKSAAVPKPSPGGPFNATGGVPAKADVGWAGATAEQQAQLAKDPSLAKAYAWAKAHPTLSTAGGLAVGAGAGLGIPHAGLIYHIARSLKGIAKLLPEVTGE